VAELSEISPSPAPIDVVELTVEKAQSAFAAGTITSERLTQAFLDRIAKFNPQYNAIIFLNPDALTDARAIDRRRAAGETLGPLAGIPVVVKDTMDMAGVPTTAGWSLLYSKTGGIDLIPSTDAPVVARLRAAGAIVLGKTNVPILSHTGTHADDSWAGPTYNGADRAFVPGGSSAGSATAVAASMAVFGLGEETGGSIQNPASAQALVGVKPSLALVPTAGVVPLSGLRDVVGPIARCVRDAALALDALAGYSPEDPKTIAGVGHRPSGGYAANFHPDALRGRRIGTYGPGWRNQPLSAETARHYLRAKVELQAGGAVLVDDPFAGTGFADQRRGTPPLDEYDGRGLESVPYDLEKYLERLGPKSRIRSFREFAETTAREDAIGPKGVLRFLHSLREFAPCLANPSQLPEQSEFIAVKEFYLETFNSVFAREKLDALVFPQMREELPKMFSGAAIAATTVSEINIAGLPAVTMPAGYYDSGAPFCLVFVGPMWSEADLLSFAYAYESATKHRRTPVLREKGAGSAS
jgi:Asp-tRNA(Asn)/Glu-tRNA(Gln) amidotransferase A subunit family amidase